MKLFKWHSDVAERMRVALGWGHYAVYWVSFFKGVAVTCLAIWLICQIKQSTDMWVLGYQ